MYISLRARYVALLFTPLSPNIAVALLRNSPCFPRAELVCIPDHLTYIQPSIWKIAAPLFKTKSQVLGVLARHAIDINAPTHPPPTHSANSVLNEAPIPLTPEHSGAVADAQ